MRDSLLAISPIDGRYQGKVSKLRDLCSEFGLIRFRVRVEIEWFKLLLKQPTMVNGETVDTSSIDKCDQVFKSFSVADAETVRHIESETNHDVKAVEYFVKDQITHLGFGKYKELVHFGCTSEDINNLAYALMLKEAKAEVLLPSMSQLITSMVDIARSHAKTAMLARTHGQVASPTTLGKELANVAVRLNQWRKSLDHVKIYGKMNGAVGNFNAHQVSAPMLNWPVFAEQLVKHLGLRYNHFTTQIDPHDWISEYLNAIVGFNQVLLDFDRDVWSYISIGYFKQRLVEGETGSSTMPHKVNPIDFENSEGNIGIANAVAQHLSTKLQISRWQRDLSDSTALRNIGVVLAHTEIAVRSTLRGLAKLDVDEHRIAVDINDSWEVLAEAIQTVLRKQGVENPYELVKERTRGESLTQETYYELLDRLPIEGETKYLLKSQSPVTYIGLAYELTHRAIEEVTEDLSRN